MMPNAFFATISKTYILGIHKMILSVLLLFVDENTYLQTGALPELWGSNIEFSFNKIL